ncbi:DUF6186 family protein [Gryllotalpicola reticulitermitis]|uniref:DUF6186 family protein n=1 Tax=Gryllotalpicola reticulitermitis TaxID=1184153 RepID=A0ABV8Q4N2_9MICO
MMRDLTIAGYVAIGLAGVALAVFSRVRPRRIAPLGKALGRVFASRPARVVLTVFWFWLGWHFFVAGA